MEGGEGKELMNTNESINKVDSTAQVLRTKLYVPQLRQKIVSRPQLIKRLNEGLECKLTLISAPAGFGKTTLVSEWVTSCKRAVAWLSLDDSDNDPVQFLSYIVAALQSVQANFGEGIKEALLSLQTVGMESVLTALVNEVTTIPMDFVLVLDDYHVIDNQSVNHALTFLLNHIPAHMHLVITTRVDPILPLVKLRAKNQLLEIREMDLRFSHAETAGFLGNVMGLNLSDIDVKRLATRTEGWIAGLQLAAISLKGHSDIAGFIESFSGSHYFIMDYLIEEVVKQQSEDIQSFLTRTSILDRFCGSLCDAIMLDSSARGQDTLEYLHHMNMFIISLDTERRWYRYHHLFADLLRQRLSKDLSSTVEVDELHRRASQWFEDNGLRGEAIHHAVAAKQYHKAATLIELAWSDMDKSLQSATWLGWARLIPDELVRLRPVLSVGYAWALLDTGEIESCEPRLQDAERAISAIQHKSDEPNDTSIQIVVADEVQFHSLPATIASARAYRSSALGDIDATIQHAERALKLIPKEDDHTRSVTTVMLGLAQWASGELDAAYTTIADGINDRFPEINVAILLAELRTEQGRLEQASRIFEKSLQAGLDGEEPSHAAVASFYLGLCKLKLMKGDLPGATELLQRSMDKGEKVALPNWQYNWYLLHARIKESQGDYDTALELFTEAERYYFRGPMPDPQPLDALKVRVYIRQGKMQKALVWAGEHHLAVEDEVSYLREFEHVTLARVLIAEGRGESLCEAKQLVERLLSQAQKGNRLGTVVELLILQALAHDKNGTSDMALQSLREAIALAEPEEYVQVFVDEGPQMYRLLSESAVYQTRPGFVSKLLAAIEALNVDKPDSSSAKSPHILTEPLSEREFEVLQLIAQGLSNIEICGRLFLALSTVKGHNQSIFGKLQVNSRTEALARARELGLL